MRGFLAAILVFGACSATSDENSPSTLAPPTATTITPTARPITPSATTPPPTGPTATPTTAPPSTTPAPTEPLVADVVFHNGTVITLDETSTVATGLALAGDRIVAVGPGDELVARAPGAIAVDLEGRTVVPGIVDPHLHVVQSQAPDPDRMRAEEELLVQTGRTTVGVPAAIPLSLEGYLAMEDRGVSLLRSHLYLSVNNACNDPVQPEGWWRAYEFDRAPDRRVAVAGLKLFTDGGSCNVPALSFDWVDGTMGDLYLDGRGVADVLRQGDEVGALVVVHAIGDRAVEVALDGFEEALGGDNPNRHRIDHNTLVPPTQLPRYGQTGANFVGWGWFNSCLEQAGAGWASLGTDHLPWLRNHRAVREANASVAVAWHSDAPYTTADIFEQLLALTELVSLDETGEPCPAPPWLAGHEVPVEQALRMMTIEAAAAMDLERELGSLEVGKIADLAILARDPRMQEGLALLDNRVDSTWISGRAAWCDGWAACGIVPLLGGPDGPSPAVGLTVSASASRDGHPPGRALDGVAAGESFWSSGQDAPGWIQVDFETPSTVVGLRFVVFQNPEGDTVHTLELRVGGAWRPAARFEQFTATGDVLEWDPPAPVAGVEAFRMTTLASPSWPEWYEIEIVR